MPPVHLLRVFCDERGAGGNPLAVLLDAAPPAAERQAMAAELGLSETVFVEDAASGAIRIHTPTVELGFAGHPSVGAAWLLARERSPVAALRPPAGDVPVRREGEDTFVAARPEWGPAFEWRRMESPKAVEALEGPPAASGQPAVWAWLDEQQGLVRARVFPLEIGIEEDEATGAAALRLGAALGRPLEIRQGRGSRLLVRTRADGLVEVGGRVVLDELRDYEPAR